MSHMQQTCFDFEQSPSPRAVVFKQRAQRGERSFEAGKAAEEQVARHYCERGYELAKRRWRGTSGEVDLLFRLGGGVVAVEVKQSRTHAQAKVHLRPPQLQRICQAVEEFAGTEPAGLLTDIRIDVATVDQFGTIEILENALLAG